MNIKSTFMIFVLMSLLTACTVTFSPSNANPENNTAQPLTQQIPSANLAVPTARPPEAPPPTGVIVGPAPVITAEPNVRPTCPTPLSVNQAVLDRASEVMFALSKMDTATVSKYVHPSKGLRFSPYSYVRDTDLVFSANEVASLPASSKVYFWGSNAGSDAPINLSFVDYYKDFIYDVDFLNAPQMSLNHRLGGGSSIDNALEFYPNAKVVEYYFPGFDAKYQGMDWRSLRLAFSEANGTWYLVGIIHDEWTP